MYVSALSVIAPMPIAAASSRSDRGGRWKAASVREMRIVSMATSSSG